MTDLERSFIERVFDVPSAGERTRRVEIARTRRQKDVIAEKVAAVHELVDDNIRMSAYTAQVRNAAAMIDPAGAELYASLWVEAAQMGQQVIRRETRDL